MAQSSPNANASETSPLLADAPRDVENAEAPVLGEGNSEMYKKLPVLFPAVAIGVGFLFFSKSPSNATAPANNAIVGPAVGAGRVYHCRLVAVDGQRA